MGMGFWLVFGIAVVTVSYLFGSIPTGYWAGLILQGIDIRQHGSGSTGATNVLRTLGKIPALVVLMIDILKGALAIALVRWVCTLPSITQWTDLDPVGWSPWVITLAGLMVLFGHSKSVWINFTGGKSVAAGLGVFVAMSWLVGVGALLVFALVLGISRIVSLSSMSAAIAAMVLMLALQQPLPYILLALLGGSYVIFRHKQNIQRLLAGQEPRIGQKLNEPSS
jgi:glycerol-3-phosphate acyltransferase PlsY